MNKGQRAREILVLRNMGLVHSVVSNTLSSSPYKQKTHKSDHQILNSLSREDLIQEGAIGLARAVDKFHPDMIGVVKFSTYAVYWVRAMVLRCIAERDDFVRVPEHVTTTIRKVQRAASRLGIPLHESYYFEESDDMFGTERRRAWKEAKDAKALAIEAGLTDGQLKEAIRVSERRRMGGYLSFEPWMQKDMVGSPTIEGTICHNIDDSTSEVALNDSKNNIDVQSLAMVLAKFLRPKEMEALSWRYGLRSDRNNSTSKIVSVALPKMSAPTAFRDYEAEAEEDLFGASGILAMSATSNKPSSATDLSKEELQASSTVTTVVPQKGRWGEAMSFREVGQHMAISAEYGRRLCAQAIKKLQRAAEDGHLDLGLIY